MNDTLLKKDISKLFALDSADKEEQQALIDEIGEVVLDTALMRFIKTLDEKSTSALEYYVDTKPTMEMLLTHLFENYPDFEHALEEAILEVKQDAEDVLGA